MAIMNLLSGSVEVQITSGDITGCLSALAAAGVILQEIRYDTDLSFTATISPADSVKARRITEKRGDDCKIIHKTGWIFALKRLYKRAVLITGILFLMLLTIWIPRRIFFLQVEGNAQVNTQSILMSVQGNGVTFGCRRSQLRSDEIKNKIIEDIPQLDWVGITTEGCVATISVSEKKQHSDITSQDAPVSSIVASRDGIVESVTATKGTVLCKPGYAVYQGQILISGYEDLGRILKGGNAQGEVYAKTFYITEAISPRIYQCRTEILQKKTLWSLQIGKKFINFSKDSGISPTTCVKMYEERYLTLPGGFQLPVCLIRQDIVQYDLQEEALSAQFGQWMPAVMESYMKKQMLAGEIHYARDFSECLDDIFYMSSRYSCLEQIGIRKIEESWKDYGKDS